MTVQDRLNQPFTITRQIQSELRKCDYLLGLSQASASTLFDRKGQLFDRVGRTAAALADTENKIKSLQVKLDNARKETRRMIELIEDKADRKLLYFRYIKFWNWRDIAGELGVSVEKVHKRHDDLLNELERKLGQSEDFPN